MPASLFYIYSSLDLFNDTGKLIQAITGFSLGASSIALFARVGEFIQKAADVGADLVGKVEAGIPEDHPLNHYYDDNVGDNVGDVAGMGADLYESYCGSILAATAIGASLADGHCLAMLDAVMMPMIIAGAGILVSIIGNFNGVCKRRWRSSKSIKLY